MKVVSLSSVAVSNKKRGKRAFGAGGAVLLFVLFSSESFAQVERASIYPYHPTPETPVLFEMYSSSQPCHEPLFLVGSNGIELLVDGCRGQGCFADFGVWVLRDFQFVHRQFTAGYDSRPRDTNPAWVDIGNVEQAARCV